MRSERDEKSDRREREDAAGHHGLDADDGLPAAFRLSVGPGAQRGCRACEASTMRDRAGATYTGGLARGVRKQTP